MKRLKYACPFYGHAWDVLGLCILLWTVTLLWCAFSEKNLPLWLSLLPPACCALAVFCWLHRLREEERRWIADAPLPLWQPVTTRDCAVVRHPSMRSSTFCIELVLCSVVLVGGIWYLRTDAVMANVLILTMLVVIGTAICRYLCDRHWQEIDETALAVSIPVQRSFTQSYFMGGSRMQRLTRTYEELYEMQRGRRIVKQYLVCYLPDGKYVLCQNPPATAPQRIRVVQYGGHLRWYLEA